METHTGHDEYRESIGYAPVPRALITAAIVGCLVAFILMLIFSRSVLSRILVSCVLLVLTLATLNFRRLVFHITAEEVSFGFGVIEKRFPRSGVLSCEPCELRFSNYLGYGIRLGRDGTIAYNTRNGRGVKMVIEGKKRPYVVSVNDPQRVCEMLDRGPVVPQMRPPPQTLP